MKTKKPLVKRLFWDIETSPNVVLSWRIGNKVSIGHDNIIKERAIVCICWKWEHENKVHSLNWDQFQNDLNMLAEFSKVAEEADELVAQYGDNFDLPFFKMRCLFHRIPIIGRYKTVDTKAWADKLYFNCSKLDYLGSLLGHGGKLKTDFELWKKVCLLNDRTALDYMVKYCKDDVVKLEKVYNDLLPFNQPKTHAGVFSGGDKWHCAYCASQEVVTNKRRVTAMGTVQHQMKCHECHRSYTISDASHAEYLKAKKKREQ